MPVTITDQQLHDAGLSEHDARVEIACRLFEAGRLSLPAAGRWAGLTRTQLEAALVERNIPLVRLGVADLEEDLRAIARLGASR